MHSLVAIAINERVDRNAAEKIQVDNISPYIIAANGGRLHVY